MRFYEFVVEAPLLLTKGFVYGWIRGKGIEDEVVYFSKILGIERSTLSDALREWFGLENLTHFVVREDIAEDLKKCIERCTDRLGIKLKSVRPIKAAQVEFSFSIYNRDLAQRLKKAIEKLPAEYIKKHQEKETYIKEAEQTEMYAPLHPYIYEGEYEVEGPFQEVIEFYKEIREIPQVKEEPLKLIFED